jgi:hypothetical protein
MLEIALDLAVADPAYEAMACKFFENFLWLAASTDHLGGSSDSMWDEDDGFYYDVLRVPGGGMIPLKVRSVIGLLPLCASTVIPAEAVEKLPGFMARAQWFAEHHPDLMANIAKPGRAGVKGRHLLALVNEEKLRKLLARMLDPAEFLSDHGIRSISRMHVNQPCLIQLGGREFRVEYQPAESSTDIFGGNTNWRGPVWMPVNLLILRALLHLYQYYGNDFTVECPVGSGRYVTLFEAAQEIARRLTSIFLRDEHGHRPLYGGATRFQEDPYWRDHILFYEYFHGDNGAGLGASHQTGWTGVIARIMQVFASVDGQAILDDRITERMAARQPGVPVPAA